MGQMVSSRTSGRRPPKGGLFFDDTRSLRSQKIALHEKEFRVRFNIRDYAKVLALFAFV